MELTIPHRRQLRIEKQVAATLVADSDFGDLVSNSILELKFTSNSGYTLQAGAYVGRVRIGKCSLVIGADVVDDLEVLKSYAFGTEKRLPGLYEEVHFSNPLAVVLRDFVDDLADYVSLGVSAEYVRVLRTSSIVRGALDVRATFQRRVHGQPHLLVSRTSSLDRNTDRHSLFRLALLKVLRLGPRHGLDEETLLRARSLLAVFPLGPITGDISRRDRQSIEFGARGSRKTARLITQAFFLLDDLYLGLAESAATPRPGAYFVDLSTLFEDAVRETLGDELKSMFRVRRGVHHGRRLFSNVIDHYKLEPDIVVGSAPVVAVGDAKYKYSLENYPLHSDVYQLLVHTAGFRATQAFFVYPGSIMDFRDLGETITGIRVRVFVIRVQHLREDVRSLAEHILKAA